MCSAVRDQSSSLPPQTLLLLAKTIGADEAADLQSPIGIP
jgi:hypothetical protein